MHSFCVCEVHSHAPASRVWYVLEGEGHASHSTYGEGWLWSPHFVGHGMPRWPVGQLVWHAVHEYSSAGSEAYLPGVLHMVQAGMEPARYHPRAHLVHALAPAVGASYPSGHGVHASEDSSAYDIALDDGRMIRFAWYVPGGHIVHPFALDAWYPAPHTQSSGDWNTEPVPHMQNVWSGADTRNGGHSVH